MTISQRSMVSFPWKQNIKSSGSPSSSARQKKSGQPPRQKTHEPQEQRQFFNLQQKIKTKFWSCSRKLSTRADGGMFWFARLFLANLVCFVFKFPQTKDSENLSTISKKIVNPERRFVLPENTKHDGISCFQSPTWWARGGFKHRAAFAALSSRQTTRGQPTPQRSREEGLLDGGNGWGRRVAERLWLLEIMTKIISWKILESGTCSEICYSNPVESCPPFVRRPQRAVAAWFDNATVDGAIISESCYTAADHLNSEWPGESEAATECRGDSVNADERPVDTGASISPDEHLLLY